MNFPKLFIEYKAMKSFKVRKIGASFWYTELGSSFESETPGKDAIFSDVQLIFVPFTVETMYHDKKPFFRP